MPRLDEDEFQIVAKLSACQISKEVIVLKLSSFSRNVKQNRRKNWRLGKYFLGIKNNAELNRWTKKISDICGLSFYFSLSFVTIHTNFIWFHHSLSVSQLRHSVS